MPVRYYYCNHEGQEVASYGAHVKMFLSYLQIIGFFGSHTKLIYEERTRSSHYFGSTFNIVTALRDIFMW